MEPVINIIDKNILYADDPVIAHCCNIQNTMGAGVAKALRDNFPEIYQADTRAYITYGKDLLGKCIMVPVEGNAKNEDIRYIANLYGQSNYGNDTRYLNYEAIYKALEELREQLKKLPFINMVGMPYKIGCNRAGGSWPIVLEMIKSIFENTGKIINFYRL